MKCTGRGPDLLARALARCASPASAPQDPELEAHVAACAGCAADAERLETEVRAARAAAPAPPAALRSRLLAAVRDEAAERRAEARGDRRAAEAVAAARSCPDVREDLAALVLGHLDPAARSRVASHVAACAPCDDERRATERLVAAQRSALRLDVPAALRARVLGAIRTEHVAAAPPPPSADRAIELRRTRTRIRRLSWLVPLAVAASLFATVFLTPPTVGLHVQDDVGALFLPRGGDPGGRWIDRATGELSLRPGDGVASGERSVDLRLRFDGRPPDGSAGEPAEGEMRVRLDPGTRLVRVEDAVFELRTGRISVHAGPLGARVTVRHGDAWARIVGTRFDASVFGGRLVVSVAEGRVAVGSGSGAAARTAEIGAGEDALVDGERLLTRRSDGLPASDAFLAPRLELEARTPRIGTGAALELDAELAAGPAGPVTVVAFDDSDPRVLVRLKGPDGRTVEAKVQRSMLTEDLPASPTVRLDEGRRYRLRIRLDGLALEPGRWEATVRYQSYGARPDGSEWHGSVESAPAAFEVVPR